MRHVARLLVLAALSVATLFTAAGVTVIAQTRSVSAGDDSLMVQMGRLAVSLGMSEDEVWRRASAARQHLNKPPALGGATALVWESEKAGDGGEILGSIAFRDGRVDWVSKRWTPPQSFPGAGLKDTDIGNALFGVASEFVKAGRTQCTLAIETQSSPGQLNERVAIRCGRRSIDIATLRSDEHRIVSTSVTEMVK